MEEKRLIDANDVYSLLDKSGFARLHVADIDTIPRVDAVEVVRCRDCKFGMQFGDPEDEWINCWNLHGNPLMPFDGFCSYGESYRERKDGDGNG